MKIKLQITFFIVLFLYLAILGSGSYVSVYITYFALPVLALLGFFGFVTINSIHQTAKFIFVSSLLLSILTIASVSYVGVYLVPIEATILLVSGIVMMVTKE